MPVVEGVLNYTILVARNGIDLFAAQVADETLTIEAEVAASWAVPPGGVVDITIRQSGAYGLSNGLAIQLAL
jgi:hypothetical protein